MEFSSGNTNSLTSLTDLVPFPLDFPQETYVTLRKTYVTLVIWGNDSFPYILDGFRAISHVALRIPTLALLLLLLLLLLLAAQKSSSALSSVHSLWAR